MNTARKYDFKKLQHRVLKSKKPLVVLLQRKDRFSLQEEIINEIKDQQGQVFDLIKITCEAAKSIQEELNIRNCPALIVLNQNEISGIFQGLFSKQEINNHINKINNK